MTDAEIITTAIISAMFFSVNYEKARNFMVDTGLVKKMLSKSCFCSRIHATLGLVYDIFHQLSMRKNRRGEHRVALTK